MKRLAALALAVSLVAAPALAQTRPTPPGARPPLPAITECDQEASRKAIVGGAETQLNAVQAYMEAYGAYSEAAATWKTDQMVAKGAWTEADREAFGKSLLEDKTFTAMTDANLKEVEKLLALLTPFIESLTAGDETKTCRALVDFMGAAYQVVDSTEKQWRYLDGKIEAAARAKGVTLD